MGEKKNNSDKKNDAVSAVLKIDMHCSGCVDKIVKCVKTINGVESVKAEMEANKLTVVGKMDPLKVKEKLELKTKKKVDFSAPQESKKDKKENKSDNKENEEKKKDNKEKSGEKTDSKKPKEVQVNTVILQVELHCQGCVEKINKVLSRTKGVVEKAIDKQKDQVIVKGSMDVKGLVECLKDRLKRDVEVVQPKKEKEGGDDKNKGGGKKKGGDGDSNADDGKLEESKMAFMTVPGYGVVPVSGPGFGYPPPQYANGFGYPPQQQLQYVNGFGYPPQQPQYVNGYPGYNGHLGAPQIFSDENPNACSIM